MAKSKPTPTPSPKKLPKVWHLIKQSSGLIKHNPKLLTLVGIILLPTSLLISFTNTATNGSSGFTTLASLLMNLALIWAISQALSGKKISIKDAYFKGTAKFVEFLVVALTLVLMLLPLITGVAILALGVIQPGTLAAERVLLTVLAALLIVPTLRWVTRYALALYIVPDSNFSPMSALRRSRELVKGRFWPVFGRLVAVAIITLVAGLIPLAVPIALHFSNRLGLFTMQFVIGLLVLPFYNTYLYNLYLALDGQKPSR